MSQHNAHHHGHNETLTFNSFSGYYGTVPNGYGGFDWSGVYYINETYWQNIKTNWCDTGYQNVCDSNGVAYIYDSGLIESSQLSETFTLKSMITASAWNSNAVWDVKSYSYSNGSLTLKASDSLTVSQTATKLNFAKFGAKGDFTNISAVFFELASTGSYGNTCSYNGGTSGPQIVFDNLKVHWNGKIPTGHGELRGGHMVMPHAHNAVVAHLMMPNERSEATSSHPGASDHSAGTHHDIGGYHSMLTSLDAALGHDPGHGLTSQFVLPQAEHFGS